jgi:hypothetical protein
MGAQLRFGTAGATGGGFSAQPGSLQPALEELRHEPRWQWQCRAPKTWKDKNRWYSLWSFGCRVGYGSPSGSDGAAPIGGLDLTSPDLFEPFSCDGEGSPKLVFIKGTAVDTSDVALSGVNLQAFRTSDDAFAGYEVQSREDGSYDLPTNFPSVNHYVVAYLAGSPDRGGTTLNTLTPTNIDGT